MSLIIENGRVYSNGRLAKGSVIIDEGRIQAVTSAAVRAKADERIDAKGKLVLPGAIDPHVHFRDPGLTHKEDFRTGSFAAAAGGVTCVLDMPNTKPPVLTAKLLDEKREIAASKSIVNFGLHFGSSAYNLGEMLKARGFASVKIFMDATTGDMLIGDEKAVKDILSHAGLCSLHAEGENVRKAISLASGLGKKFYLCHVSEEREIGFVKQNNRENVFAEATPHHLFLTEKDQSQTIRMKPSLKRESDRRSLWASLLDGSIDAIGSDHAPHTPEEKENGEVFGVPGVETSLPLMLDAVAKGRIPLKRVVEAMCENPARIFRLKNKGAIAKGFDADVTIVDMKLSKAVRSDMLFTKCGWSPFEGFELRGWPVTTIVNGNVVFGDGEITDKIKGKEVEYG